MADPTPDAWRRVDRYLTETLVGHDPTLAAAVDKLAASHEAAVRERVSAERTDAAASTPDTPKVD